MALTATPVFPQAPKSWQAALLSTTGAYTFVASTSTASGRVTLITAGANGTLVEGITITSSDSATKDLQLIILNSVDYIVTTLNIPANSGFTNSVIPVDLFRSSQVPGLGYDVNGNRFLYLPSGSSLCVATTAALTAAKQISVIAIGADF